MIASIDKKTGASAANTAQTVSTLVGNGIAIHHIAVVYSAAPTHAGVTVTLNSGTGAAYDTQLVASAANAQNYSFIPSTPIIINGDDAIDVLAPAGGAGITSQVSIYYQPVE